MWGFSTHLPHCQCMQTVANFSCLFMVGDIETERATEDLSQDGHFKGKLGIHELFSN